MRKCLTVAALGFSAKLFHQRLYILLIWKLDPSKAPQNYNYYELYGNVSISEVACHKEFITF